MHKPIEPQDLGFTFKVRKGGEVEISHHGRLATTLRSKDAERFLRRAVDEPSADVQQLMARATGNYKRGNERKASEHDRNRK